VVSPIYHIIWRVGDGEQISLTRDRWVPGSSTHQICPTILLPDGLKVSFLINGISSCWNEGLVRACFSAADADLVLKLPVSMNRIQDFVSWPHTKSGIYTVKYAYFMARTESSTCVGVSMGEVQHQTKQFWPKNGSSSGQSRHHRK
jgi:hypothetical protein